ncbi:heavy metal sensor histidine kinase [Intestinirhabdus alba]|jgi:two-component system OmpR family sensor kinase|uniref:Sensor protein n=1 Tax=Intestinirhabdus alba TaxID=2899544 RepID=A0A6L6INN6_9ENTR|nr:heavy metal sensor histidine kinase [Intestinirhabdus alba]MTH48129.1 heavy metal sensor histidine kinase [Intestinirhabdus alba]
MPELSMTLRLTLTFVLTLALACTGISWTLYRALSGELTWRDDVMLVNRANQIGQLLQDGAEPQSLPLYFNRMMDTRQDILLIHTADSENITINHTGVQRRLLEAIPMQNEATIRTIARTTVDGTQLSAVRLAVSGGEGPLTITVARLASERKHMLEQYRYNSVLICIIAVLACAALSPLLIRRGLRSISALSRLTADTDSRGLRQPLRVSDLPAELKPLGSALNVMRRKLADDFARLNQFADDLAHELRTPVNILLGHNQVALARPRMAEEYQQVLANNVEELEGLSRLTESILFLARAEHHAIRLKKAALPCGEIIAELVDFLSYSAEEKQIAFAVHCSGEIVADRVLLQRVLINLLSNAIRYSPDRATIRITTRAVGEQRAIEIANPGEPFAAPENLFNRFWRGDNARHSPGYGLGLSLVKAVMALHGGGVSYRFADGQHRFTVAFPEERR